MKNVAIITGGSSGVGKAIAGMLAKSGWRVYACSRSLD
ncbi:MAG TPA: SDR family NAD(P)-dependent oxidoreductase, partial [Clostridia bacterium]|nr:SDR family NAD(P)-dependent oxidoreductase [Clostridia bacterium]